MKRFCAIDFDGVILRNHPIQTIVAKRCNAFVAKKMSLEAPRAEAKNKELYETTGHTLLGLKKIGVRTSLKEFNEFVYNHINYEEELANFEHTHYADIDGLDSLLHVCHDENITPFVFSNAPSTYVYEILKRMAKTPHLINHLHTADQVTKDLLKPDKDAYHAIERNFTGKNPYRPASFIFIDDKLNNLLPTLIRPNWQGILIAPHHPVNITSNFIITSPSLKHLSHRFSTVVI